MPSLCLKRSNLPALESVADVKTQAPPSRSRISRNSSAKESGVRLKRMPCWLDLEPAHLCVRSGSRTRFGPCFSPNLGISGGFTLGSLIGRTVAALHEDGRPSLHLFHELGMTLGERVELIVAALIGPHRLAHGRKGRAQALEDQDKARRNPRSRRHRASRPRQDRCAGRRA